MLSLDSIPYDAEFEEGARNAIETCLGVRPGERLTLITDLATCEIAASLLAAARRRGAQVECFVLEDEAPRPLSHCPPSILRGVANSTVVVGCFHPQEGEILSRRELIDLVERKRIKYAHMIWMSPSIMCQSMRADYYAVDALSNRVLSCVRGRRKVVVHSPAGTDIEVTLHRDHLWIKTSGLISPMYWSNLPGGEVWCAPEAVNGVFVVDGTVGDYLCPKYGDISATPLTWKSRTTDSGELTVATAVCSPIFLSTVGERKTATGSASSLLERILASHR